MTISVPDRVQVLEEKIAILEQKIVGLEGEILVSKQKISSLEFDSSNEKQLIDANIKLYLEP